MQGFDAESASVQARSLTRRQVVRGGLAFGGSALAAPLIAACGGSGDEATSKTGGSSAGGVPSGTITFLGWQAYDLRFAEMNQWRKQHQLKMRSTYIGDQSDVPSKLTTGGGQGVFNLSCYSVQYAPQYHGLGIMEPIDLEKVPNFQDSLDFFKGESINKYLKLDGQQWGIPFTWAYETINYDASKIKPPTHTADLVDPKFKGKFALSNDLIAVVLMSAQALGIAKKHPDGYFTHAELDQIKDFLMKVKANARTVTPSYGDVVNLYASGDIVMNWPGYPGMSVLVAEKGNKNIKSVVPQEGTFTWIDTFFVPKGAKDTDAVHAFINESLTPPMQAKESPYLIAGITTKKGVDALAPRDRKLFPYDNLDTLFEKAPLFGYPTEKRDGFADLNDWTTMFESVKA
jgi:spermidine/putrescine transport system substrate-binding protein